MQNQSQVQTNPNAHLLDESVKAPFMGNERRSRKIDSINETQSNTDGENANQENAPVEQTVNETQHTVQTKAAMEEKRYLGMKPKTAIIVGCLSLVVIGGVIFYFYSKSKKNAKLSITE